MGAFEVNLALLAATAFGGAFVRSHWPKIWTFLAPVFGAAQSVAQKGAGLGQQLAPYEAMGCSPVEALASRPLPKRPPFGGWTIEELQGFHRSMRKEIRLAVEEAMDAVLEETFAPTDLGDKAEGEDPEKKSETITTGTLRVKR